MRVTIVKDDNTVYVEEQPLSVDCSSLPDDLSVVQWYGTWGEVEFLTDFSHFPPQRKPNEVIHDMTAYQAYVSAWMVEAQNVDVRDPLPESAAGGVHVIAD